MLSDAALKSELKYFSGGLLLCTFVSQDPKALMGPLQGGEKKGSSWLLKDIPYLNSVIVRDRLVNKRWKLQKQESDITGPE